MPRPLAEVDSLKSIAYATYLDSNVKAEVFTATVAAKGEASKFLPDNLSNAQAVLVSADGKRALPVSLTVEGKPLSVTAWDGLESVFDSQRRNAVVSKVYEHYGVILIVEGKNADENARIRKMADTVVATITSQDGQAGKRNPRAAGGGGDFRQRVCSRESVYVEPRHY